MMRRYILKSPIKIARISRLIAKAVDLLLVAIFISILPPFGTLLAIAYLVVCDLMNRGQSIGKRLIGLGVISLSDGRPCSLKQSMIRNLPLILPISMLIIPFWGYILGILMGLPLVCLELYLLFTLDSGHRLGDIMADTTVIANDPHRPPLKKKHNNWFESENTFSFF